MHTKTKILTALFIFLVIGVQVIYGQTVKALEQKDILRHQQIKLDNLGHESRRKALQHEEQTIQQAEEKKSLQAEIERLKKDLQAKREAKNPIIATVSASAPSGSVWDRLAQCEATGNWAINTGNGFYGGLQFTLQTWAAYGGQGMPHLNSREQQIAIAEKVLAAAGGRFTDWPGCRAKLGLP